MKPVQVSPVQSNLSHMHATMLMAELTNFNLKAIDSCPYHASQVRNVTFDLIFAEFAMPPFQSSDCRLPPLHTQ